MIRRSLAVLFLLAVLVPFVTRAQTPPRIVPISAKKFEFTPNVVTLKRGETVTLRLTSLDRPHGFLQKDLGFDADIDPSKPVDVTITPKTPGRYTVICDDYCGSGHGNMKMTIVVE